MSSSNQEKYKYKIEIQQMMFVSGETCDPPVETTSLIEDIVRSQVVEMLFQASSLAFKRGARSIASEDLIFLIRHDQAKVSRLTTYLSWKDLRKNAKEQEGGGVEGADLLEDAGMLNTAGGAGGAPGADKKAAAVAKTHKIRLPWELAFMFREQPLEDREGDEQGPEDEEELEVIANKATIQRLKMADERTRHMTREEYVHWSECRQASFTFRKARRFREWAGISYLTDSKPHDDIIDILGFLTFEIVATLTEEGLKIKEQEEELEMRSSKNSGDGTGGNGKKRKREHHLFDGPDEDQKPILARHIEEAFRRMQTLKPRTRALRRFGGGLVSTKTQIL